MRVFIAGSRHITPAMRAQAIKAVQRIHERGYDLVCGDANGIDAIVMHEAHRLGVPTTVYGAKGRIRNSTSSATVITTDLNYTARDRLAIDQGDIGYFIWNGRSEGTIRGYRYAQRQGYTAYIWRTP